MEKHQSGCIDVIQRLELGVVDAETVQKTNRVDPPRDVLIQEERRYDEQTRKVVYVERFEANAVATVNGPLDWQIIDVVYPGEEEEDPGEVISPQFFVDVGVEQSGEEGDDEWEDKNDVTVDPYLVGQIVVAHPVDV